MAASEWVASAEGREAKRSEVDRGDRLSSLPDSIVHHIFSFLEKDDISRFGSLSKNCRQIFVTGPHLKLGLRCDRDASASVGCKPSIDRVNRLLSLRSGLSIRSFALRWRCEEDHCTDHANSVHNWIENLVSCGLEELHIDVWVRNNEKFFFPRSAFNSRFLRVLKLNMRGFQLHEPDGVLVFLQELSLSSVRVAGYSLKKWVSDSACPSLKKLTLSRIEGNYREENEISITSASIEELTIRQLSYHWDVVISAAGLQKLYVYLDLTGVEGPRIRRIFAPNLQELTWKGKMIDGAHLNIPSEFKHLKKATLDLHWGQPRPPGNLTKLFEAVYLAQESKLNREVLEQKLKWLRGKLTLLNYELEVRKRFLNLLIAAKPSIWSGKKSDAERHEQVFSYAVERATSSVDESANRITGIYSAKLYGE